MSNPKFPLGSNLSTLVLVIQTNEISNIKKFTQPKGDPKFLISGFEKLMEQFLVGAFNSNMDTWTNNGYSKGTVTLSSHIAGDTVTVNGVVLTASSTLQDATHYKIGATDAATAINLATCINAASVNTVVFAAQDTTTSTKVNVWCRYPGTVGNLCTLAISAHGSVVAPAGGTDGTFINIASGL